MANSKKDSELEKINEEEAYFELCQIIAEAVQTQDINLLKSRIDNWKSKYPLEKFSSSYKGKIQYILNNYYLEITRYINLQTEQKKDFDSRKAYLKLYDIVNETKDLKTLKSKIKRWEKSYPLDNFSSKYKDRIKKLTSEKSLNEHALNQEEAFADLLQISKSKSTFEEFREKIDTWKKEYYIDDKYSIDDFVNNQGEIHRLTSEDYLKVLSTDNFDLQNIAYQELSILLNTPNDFYKILRWAHDYKNIKFDDTHKQSIIQISSLHYPASFLQYVAESPISVNGEDLSCEDFESIDIARKYAITRFLYSIASPSGLSLQNEHDFNIIYRKSEKAKRITIISETVDQFKDVKTKSHTLVKDTIEKFETPYSIIIPLSSKVSKSKEENEKVIVDEPIVEFINEINKNIVLEPTKAPEKKINEPTVSEPSLEPEEKIEEVLLPKSTSEPKEDLEKVINPEPSLEPKEDLEKVIKPESSLEPKEDLEKVIKPEPSLEPKEDLERVIKPESSLEPKENKEDLEKDIKPEPSLEPKENKEDLEKDIKPEPSLGPKENKQDLEKDIKPEPSLEPKENKQDLEKNINLEPSLEPKEDKEDLEKDINLEPSLEPKGNKEDLEKDIKLEPILEPKEKLKADIEFEPQKNIEEIPLGKPVFNSKEDNEEDDNPIYFPLDDLPTNNHFHDSEYNRTQLP